MRIENRFGIVKDYHHLLRGQISSQGGQVLGIFDVRAEDLGESTEEVGMGRGELIAADEPAVVAELLSDAIVVKYC